MAIGDRGLIERLDLDHVAAQRMMAVGLLPGKDLELVRVAPLGDPIQLRTGGRALSVRKNDARALLVKLGACQEKR
jgi:ferrous iron transport protein A